MPFPGLMASSLAATANLVHELLKWWKKWRRCTVQLIHATRQIVAFSEEGAWRKQSRRRTIL